MRKPLVLLLTLALGIPLLGASTGAPLAAAPAPVEVPLTAIFNNRGIAADPGATADFDSTGNAYSAPSLQVGDPTQGGGLVPGQKVDAGGFTFTWPANRVGRTDNALARGQVVPVPAVPSATRLGFLGASVLGASGGDFVLTYAAPGPDGTIVRTTETKNIRFTDWTRGRTFEQPIEKDNSVVRHAFLRHSRLGDTNVGYQPHVYLITTDVDPTRTLESVTLPVSTTIHLFSMGLK